MIDFAMSKEQQMVRNEVAKLVKGVVVDTAHDMDEERHIPPAAIQK
ncbi:MAG: acyl-CoA dehydrogenase, partial [Deltaproteobacteria bacterium]|nr:acyl-CoA dehydrogenase [Deltaproteobacteria bacterium]